MSASGGDQEGVQPEEVQPEEVVESMIAEDSFIVDRGRKSIMDKLAQLLLYLVQGRLLNKNRFNRLILGRKAVGKSALLDAIERGCTYLKEHTRKKLLVVKINCNNHLHRKSPYLTATDFFEKDLEGERPNFTGEVTESGEEKLVKFAKMHDYRVVFLVDEFQCVYGSSWSEELADEFISSIASLTESNSGRIFVVVTGSGTELRRLAFAKAQMDKDKWPNYCKRDLNHTKLQPIDLLPFDDADAFMKLCKAREVEGDFTEEFRKSAGYPGLVGVVGVGEYTISARNQLNHDILQRMVELHIKNPTDQQWHDDGRTNLECLMNMITPVRWCDLSDSGSPERSVGYELMDDGLVIFHESLNSEITVRFATPQVYWDCLSEYSTKTDARLTVQEVAHLAACGALAEEPALRMLAIRAKSWLGISLRSHSVVPLPQTLSKVNFEHLYKDGDQSNRDIRGVDGIVLSASGSEVLVHCIQLKLGRSSMNLEPLHEIIRKFESGQDGMRSDLKIRFDPNSDTPVFNFKYYLVTTKFVKLKDWNTATGKTKLEISLLDHKILGEKKIWPDILKAIHPMFK